LSDRKIRIPTQESVESGNSANGYLYQNLNTPINQNMFSNSCQHYPNVNKNTPKSGSNIAFGNEEYKNIVFLRK